MITIYGSTLVEFSTTETSLLQGSKTGSLTLPANFFTQGKQINFKANGVISGVSGSTLTLKFKVGESTIESNYTFTKNIVNTPWNTDITVICDTQNYAEPEAPTDVISGSYSGGGKLILGSDTVDTLVINFGPIEKSELNTDVEQIIDFTAQWDKESLQNSISCVCADITTPAADISAVVPVAAMFASSIFGRISGQYCDNSFHGLASSTLAGAAGRIDLAPFFVSEDLSVDQIGVAVSTAVASALGKIVVYDSDSSGWPNQRLFYGSTNLDFGTTGYKYHSEGFTFRKGTVYWLGVHHSSTATLRSINIGSAMNLGIAGSTGSTYYTVLRRVVTFASGAPTSWVFNAAERTASITPVSIRMRMI